MGRALGHGPTEDPAIPVLVNVWAGATGG
jgi:hypothetical protein